MEYNELDGVIDCLGRIARQDSAYPTEVRNEATSLERALLETDWDEALIQRLDDFASELFEVPNGEADAEYIWDEITDFRQEL